MAIDTGTRAAAMPPITDRAGLVSLHAKRLVGTEWRHEPLWVRAAAVLVVDPRYGDDGTPCGARVLIGGECWLLVTESPSDVLSALQRARSEAARG